jgi:hypothetical protein
MTEPPEVPDAPPAPSAAEGSSPSPLPVPLPLPVDEPRSPPPAEEDPLTHLAPPDPWAYSGEIRMPIGAAVAWSCGTILGFWVLAGLASSIRADLITLFACEAIALLGSAAFIWLIYGRSRRSRDSRSSRPQAPAIDLPPDLQEPLHAILPPRERALDFFAIRAAHPGFYPIALLLGLAIHLPVEAVFRFIDRRWPGPSHDLARSFLDAGPAKKVVIGAILVAIGPLVEEIFFRGALYRPLQKTSPIPATIAVTSVMFAVSHFAPQTYVPIAVVGLALGVARHASGSLIPPLLLHGAFNGLSLLAMATAPSGDAADRSAPPLWVTLAGTAVTVGLTAGLWALGARARGARADPR